jgi:hypothetical protein
MCKTDRWGRWSSRLYVHHDKHATLEPLKIAFFALIVVPSLWHRTKIRLWHDGIAGASRSRVSFWRLSRIFVFTSYCLLEAKIARLHRWSHEEKTNTTRFDMMALRRPYEGQIWHTNSTRKWTFAMSSGNFLACQRFWNRSRSCCRSLLYSVGDHTMAKDSLTNGTMLLRSDPNLNISLFACPSDAKFGTVWRQHYKIILCAQQNTFNYMLPRNFRKYKYYHVKLEF